MRAIVIDQHGGPEVLHLADRPDPQPAAGEVVVAVRGAGVNPVDAKKRAGRAELPAVLGWDVAGVVERLGDGVDAFAPGDAVFGMPAIGGPGGCYAERVAIAADALARAPESLDPVTAAAVPLAALTAWQVLFDEADLQPGERVLVHAAAGGVGTFAVQLAHRHGAHVIGTASARNAEFVRGLGADEVVDYTAGPFEETVADVDVVLDTQGGDTRERSWGVLREGGRLVSIVGPVDEDAARRAGVRGTNTLVEPNGVRLAEIARLVDAGELHVEVQEVFALADARAAHERSEAGHVRGKLVLAV